MGLAWRVAHRHVLGAMERRDYFLRRLLLTIPTLLGITIVCFALAQAVPGGPVEQYIMRVRGADMAEGGRGGRADAVITEEYRKNVEKAFGFDKPLAVRYWKWLVADRLGMRMESYRYPNKTAWAVIRERFKVSIIFGVSGFFLTYLVCIPLGIAKAMRKGTRFDLVSSAVVFAGYAIPSYALGMVLKTLFCGTVDRFWNIFPASGFVSANFDRLPISGKISDVAMHMALPILCYMIGNFAFLTTLMKNSLLEEISKDYVRTVVAKGGSFRRAVWRHAFRNALIPIATGFGGILTVMFAGSALIEKIFEIPGMGLLSLDAAIGRDYAVFMGIVTLTSMLALAGNILSDLCYVLIDPRINFQE